MFRLRLAILGAAAALALGTAGAVAMERTVGTSDPDSHGDAVSSAARITCPHGAGGVHGACVSAIASTESQDNEQAAESNPTTACKASDATEDSSEKTAAPANKSDKAAAKTAKIAEQTEDKAEHKAFAACVSGQSTAAESS